MTRTQIKSKAIELNSNKILIFNVTLCLLAAFLITYYVVQANMIAANNYKINLLNDKLNSVNEVRGLLAAKKSSMEEPARLLEFAKSHDMVEVKTPAYLFEKGSVAIGR